MILPRSFERFQKIFCFDFEFSTSCDYLPIPICLVAKEIRTNEVIRVPLSGCKHMDVPYPISSESLFIGYYASAEIGCHLALEWDVPANIIDLFAEFRCHINGRAKYVRAGLIDALTYFGLDSISTAEKEQMRGLAMRGPPFTVNEMDALIDYCESDVIAVETLLHKMAPIVDLERALLRGKYMAALAKVEHVGVPIDLGMLSNLRLNWEEIQRRLIFETNQQYGVFQGTQFRQKKFHEYLVSNKIPWPRLPSGRLNLSDETFKSMASIYPAIEPLQEVRSTLSKMRLSSLTVGKDERNRCLLSAFAAKTGRNQPSNSKFIFGPAVWMRHLIKPKEGFGLAYIDWEQQEFGIAGALSRDGAMITAYQSGDPYLGFAKLAGAVPEHGTKEAYKTERERFKQCALAVQYGMGSGSLAIRIGCTLAYGEELLNLHKKTFPKFWAWIDRVLTIAQWKRRIYTVYGWPLYVERDSNQRSLANFPMQANGAEMLRLAIIFAIERGVRVCAPVHDALLIEARTEELNQAIMLTQEAMKDASRYVLDGFELRSDVKSFIYPQRYEDPRGIGMWNTLISLLKTSELK